MNFKEFEIKRNVIYKKFENFMSSDYEESALNKIVDVGAYLIAFRHPRETTEKVELFSEKVNKIVPSIIYNRKNAHTTISDYLLGKNFVKDNKLLDKFCDIVGKVLKDNSASVKKIEFEFINWLYNSNSVILSGESNRNFFDFTKKIVDMPLNYGDNDLRMPWGEFITTSKFKENLDKHQIKELFELTKNMNKPEKSKPLSIDVCYFFNSKKKGFDLHVYDSFFI